MKISHKKYQRKDWIFRLRRIYVNDMFLDYKDSTSSKIFIQNPHPHHLSRAVAKMGAQDFDELTLWEEQIKQNL